jgi:catechol 2,3-dioxygenase-like lactoylglutathione lyase family enzyme
MHTSSGSAETTGKKPRLLGINHVALEVDDIDAALAFYGRLFTFTLRGRHEGMAFIDLGDQFIALAERRSQSPDTQRHFGLVVDDRHAVRQRLDALGVQLLPGAGLDFLDPWGNRVQIVPYREIQFTKAPQVLKGMGLAGLAKSATALRELAAKGMALDENRSHGSHRR